MIEIKRILVATDFSEHARNALDYAAKFAAAFEAEVVMCHVAPAADLLSQLPPGGEGYFPPDFSESQQKAAIEEGNRWLSEAGVAGGRMLTASGTAFIEIIRIAREENADLLVAGTHGRGAVAHMLLGSVAETLVRKSPCPVLTVRHRDHEFSLP